MTQQQTQNRYGFHNAGFTLVEMVMYVSILVIVLMTVILAIVGVMRVYTFTQAQTRIGRAAEITLARMTREIRFADSANTVTSSFGTHPGVLALTSSSPTRTTKFYLDNGVMKFDEDGVYAGNLTLEKVFVSSFIVRHIQVDSSDAVRIELTLDAAGRTGTTSETFYATAVMRGSYTQ